MTKVKRIEWSEEFKANKECRYNHCIGKTPLGDFLITWKGVLLTLMRIHLTILNTGYLRLTYRKLKSIVKNCLPRKFQNV